MSEYNHAERYSIGEIMEALNIKGKTRQALFLFFIKDQINATNLETGISADRLLAILKTLTPLQRKLLNLKKRTKKNEH